MKDQSRLEAEKLAAIYMWDAAQVQKVLDGKHHPLTDRKMYKNALSVIAEHRTGRP